MPRRLAQQRMALNDLEWPFHGSAWRAISVVDEFLVAFGLTVSNADIHWS